MYIYVYYLYRVNCNCNCTGASNLKKNKNNSKHIDTYNPIDLKWQLRKPNRMRYLFFALFFHLLSVTECQFGKVLRELGSTWYADLGPPFGVMYCIKCECVAVSEDFLKYYCSIYSLYLVRLLSNP